MVNLVRLLPGLCFALAGLVVGVQASDMSIPLALGVAGVSRPLAEGETVSFEGPAASGDYLRGTARAASGRFDLDLVSAEGRHLRRLAADASGRIEFQLVAKEARLRIKATARAAETVVEVELTNRLSREQQVAPPPTYLSPRIAALAKHLATGGDTEMFWNEIAATGTPLVEPAGPDQKMVTFLARGARHNVRLFGAPTGDHEELSRLGMSDTWFRSFVVPAATRLSYQLAYDVPELPGSTRDRRVAILATAKADPFNHHPWPADAPDAFNQESLLELPDAPEQPGLAGAGAPRGTFTRLRIKSVPLGNEREIVIYRPAGPAPDAANLHLLFLFDAEAYLSRVPTPAILDNLIAQGRLPPVIAVFVPAIDRETRGRELPGNEAFADFMALELLPRVQREIGTAVPPERTLLAGSSYGGLAAATVALRHPQVFGNAICLSGSFWWHPDPGPAGRSEYVAARIASEPKTDVRFFLTAGLFETGRPGSAGILDTSRHLRDILTAKGYDVAYREYAGGHDYVIWRGALADAVIELAAE